MSNTLHKRFWCGAKMMVGKWGGKNKISWPNKCKGKIKVKLPITSSLAIVDIPLASAFIRQVSSSDTSLISSVCLLPTTLVNTVLLGCTFISFLYHVTGTFSWESSRSNTAVLPSFTVRSFNVEVKLSLIPMTFVQCITNGRNKWIFNKLWAQ